MNELLPNPPSFNKATSDADKPVPVPSILVALLKYII
jgi:hypothetical protein